jgi:hypothetical protein
MTLLDKKAKSKPLLLTTGLDFTMDSDDHALVMYTATSEALQFPVKPKAIIVGTLYLSPEFWWQRNVAGRLVAVSMGAGSIPGKQLSIADFAQSYNTTCRSMLGVSNAKYCDLQGHIAVNDDDYVDMQMKQSSKWRKAMCARLTYAEKRRLIKAYKPARHYSTEIANGDFWRTFHQPVTPKSQNKTVKERQLAQEVQSIGESRVPKAGVILDLAASLDRLERIQQILEKYVAPLGLNMLQVRLVNDNSFAIRMHSQRGLDNPPPGQQENIINSVSKFIPIVELGSELGVEVFPEISITTNAGGWVKGGYLVQCPELFCKKGQGVPNDSREPQFLAVVYSVLRELREVFSTSSYFHLGSDERVDNLKCFSEDGMKGHEDPPYGAFERKLKKIVTMLGINPENILRYDNTEQVSYEDRVGGITHYRVWGDPATLPDIRDGEPHFFLTADILEGTIYQGDYKRTRDLVSLKPVGMMGEIRVLDTEGWESKHTGLRLIAFAMGLSSGEALSQAEFNEQIIRVCKALKLPEYIDDPDCNSAKEALKKKEYEGEDENTVLSKENGDGGSPQVTVREQMCAQFTREKNTNIMKENFLSTKASLQ